MQIIRKPLVFSGFQLVWKWNICTKWVNSLRIIDLVHTQVFRKNNISYPLMKYWIFRKFYVPTKLTIPCWLIFCKQKSAHQKKESFYVLNKQTSKQTNKQSKQKDRKKQDTGRKLNILSELAFELTELDWLNWLSEDAPPHKKWSFPLRISSVNVTEFAVSSGFGHIY